MILTDVNGVALQVGDKVKVFFQDTFTHDVIRYLSPGFNVLTVSLQHGREEQVRVRDRIGVAKMLVKL